MTDLDRILEVAQEAGRQAAHLCRAVHADTPESMDKGDKSPVTIADYGSQAVILRLIGEAFPDHGVISEEGSEHLRESAGDDGIKKIVGLVNDRIGGGADFDQVCNWIDHAGVEGAEYTWAIDPIDGTKGFLRRQQYAVAIGLMKNGVPFAGVLVCPNLPIDLDQADGQKGVMFVAAKGRGAFSVAIDGGESEQIHVSTNADPSTWRVLGSVESAHGDPSLVIAMMEEAGVGGGFVRYDSQVKYGVVANGSSEIYLRPRSKPDYRENIWDHVAGVIVCEEAGGRVTDTDGKDLDFSLGKRLLENRGILATCGGVVHEAVVAGLAAAEKRTSS
ncbi:MAG: inositol monophosphatase family protein [Planctomycetota bacterium]